MTPQRIWITARDGTRLAADLYEPPGAPPPGGRPAVLEALPYRKDDLTASSHSEDYRRLVAEGGYTVCRLDLRGTGSSAGLATDEYPAVELDDLTDVIAWLADRPGGNGRVGMFGYSYSGFNSIQAAAVRPRGLAAICAVYATDDRYADDVHYMGGALRAVDLVDYCHYMTACNALPPVPAVHGEGWQGAWHDRIRDTEPWLLRWLEEQHDGPYWRHGSLRPAYDRIECPTMIVAGWADGYRNNTFRTFEALRCEKSLLVGPWSHMAPATSRPGPHLDLVPEMIRWFDRWLCDRDTGVDREPPIRLFVRHATRPEPDLAMHAGEWRYEDTWPAHRLEHRVLRPAGEGTDLVTSRADVGTAAWITCAGGLPWGQPSDQREDDSWSLTHDWPVTEPIEVTGHARFTVRLTADRPVASLSVKLCDVFPDGTSALVTRGFLNLTHRDSSERPEPLPVGEPVEVTVELEATSWVFPAGHTLRISLAGTDWPNTWVAPAPFTLRLDRSTAALHLPVLPPGGAGTPAFSPPPPASAEPEEPDDSPPPVWRFERDVLARTTTARTSYGGPSAVRDGGHCTERYDGEVGVSVADPAHGWVRATTRYELRWPEATCEVEARLHLTSDAEAFDVRIELDAELDGAPFARRRWERRIPRRLL